MTRNEAKTITKITRKYCVQDEGGYTDEELVGKVNEIIDHINKEPRQDLQQAAERIIEQQNKWFEEQERKEQEPCEDEYIKVPKKALKYRTAGMVAYNVEWLKNHFDIERAVICGAQEPCDDATLKDIFCMGCEYKEQEPCEDAISRQDVLDQTYLWSKDEFLRVTNPFDYLRKRINSLPPFTPQSKIGYWMPLGNYDDCGNESTYKCSECGDIDTYPNNYCSNCGAKMQIRRKVRIKNE